MAPSVATQPFSLVDRYGDPAESGIKLVDVLADDRAILAQYLPHHPTSDRLISHAAGAAAEGATGDDDGV
jgi:hypothetical protein